MARREASHWRPEQAPKRGPLGLWASALFNLCAAVLPLCAAYAVVIVERDRLYAYAPTAGAARATRAQLERIAARLPGAEDRRQRWDDYVASALMEGDLQAARGFMLSARAMLPPADRSSLNRSISGAARDAEIEAAALDLLTPGTRARYESRVPLLLRRASVATVPGPVRSFIVTGDAADFEAAALADLEEPNADHLAFVLMGLGVVLAGQNPPDTLAGASILQAGLAGGRISPAFHAALGARADEAISRPRFRNEVARRAIAGMAPEERGTMFQDAFRAGLDPAGLARFQRVLAEIGAIGEAATPQGALILLRHARNIEDLRRLRLIAETNPERAIAVARYAPADVNLPDAGRGQLRITAALAAPLAAAVLCLALMALAALTTTAHAIGRVLEGVNIIQRPRLRLPDRPPRLVRAFDR